MSVPWTLPGRSGQRLLVKLCGIREPRHAEVAVEAGADLIGVVFYPKSSRYVSVEQARSVAAVAHGGGIGVVGLFVNERPEEMNRIADDVGLDLIQLSGSDGPEAIGKIERPCVGSVRVDSTGSTDEQRHFDELVNSKPAPWAILIDSHVHGMYGGTGTVADWFVATDFAARYPTFLAGGLRPDTVADAIRVVRPFAVDVSTGVETDGTKDPAKMRAFVLAARSAMIETRNHGIHAHRGSTGGDTAGLTWALR